ncbi:MAG TPA: hypothetical protein VHV78_12910, partial [Gemmatimonadaceae bacterium]|nr:hypothetical protein [Gemmatimonadaceae bacterium]
KFSALSAGAAHTCGLTLDGSAFCWGSNSSGQLGDGTSINKGGPTVVSGGFKFQSIGTGNGWTCGLSGGSAYCWGAGTNAKIPVAYTGVPAFSSMSVGAAHACALTSDGSAYCWGDNSGGQLGDSTTTSRTAPTPVVTDLKFKSISAGSQHTCAITTDGFVACWGTNVAGEIGLTVPTTQLTPRYIVLGVTPPP